MEHTIEMINQYIQMEFRDRTDEISDGFHTFDELYKHRCALFVSLCNVLIYATEKGHFVDFIWKSRKHNDGTDIEGWFLAGMETSKGQLTYHLPNGLWHHLHAQELDCAPCFDGHSSEDVVRRLRELFY